MDTQLSELDLYKMNQAELLKKYDGKIIALQGGKVQGVYSSKVEALEDMHSKGFASGSFLIIKCTAGDEEYTRRYRSRVDFPKKVA